MRGGGVAARAAHDVRLQQAAKDALQCTVPLFRACPMHMQMSATWYVFECNLKTNH